MNKKRTSYLLVVVCLALGVCVLGAGNAQAKKKVQTKKYTVTVQKGLAYTVADLEEDLESATNSKKKFPVSVASKDLKWTASSKNVKLKGKTFTVKKKGTYKLTGTYKNKKKYQNYKYVVTVKAVTKKETVTENYTLAIQSGTTYNMKTAAKDLQGFSDKMMLYYIYNKQSLVWKSNSSKLTVKGNEITASEPGEYVLTGYNKYNKTYQYKVALTVYAPQYDTKLSNVKKIEIMKEGKTVTIDDPAKIAEFCSKFGEITYAFDYTGSNASQTGYVYSVTVYSDGSTPVCQFTTGSTIEKIKIFRGASYQTANCAGFGDLLTRLYENK